MCVCVCVCTGITRASPLKGQKSVLQAPEAEVAGSGEPLSVDARNQTPILGKNKKCLELLSHLSSRTADWPLADSEEAM